MSRACLASSAAERRGLVPSASLGSLRGAFERAGLRARGLPWLISTPSGNCSARADAIRGTDSSHSPISPPGPAHGEPRTDPVG